MMDPGAIQGARPGVFSDAFFFSVQTLSTIGYGSMYPEGLYANMLVMIQSLLGVVITATATGLVFTKFAHTRPRVLFSQNAVVYEEDGETFLALRLANERRAHPIQEARIRLTLVQKEERSDGEWFRRLTDLKVVRDSSPLFALSWTVFHRIDKTSPLYGANKDSIGKSETVLLVTMSGIDDSLSETVHARHAYTAHDIRYHMRFANIIVSNDQGETYVDYTKFNSIVKCPDSPPSANPPQSHLF